MELESLDIGDLDDFVDSVAALSERNRMFLAVPDLVNTANFNYPLLMKRANQKKIDSPRSTECKKCEANKKQLEERIKKLEAEMQFQHDQLFELYSHLNAKVDSLTK